MASRGLSLVLSVGFLLSTVAAGCLSSTPNGTLQSGPEDLLERLSKPVYDAVEKVHVPVPGHDGKIQDTWVYKPKTDDPDAKFPVFINFSPYWSNSADPAGEGGDAFSEHMISYFVPRGYAVVLASVRGTGNSEGCFPIGGVKELEDAYAVIDHYANVAWSNGHIASGGKSYDGTTIQGVAGYKPHPALKLVFPVSAISDLYRYNYRGGVPYGQGPIFNAYYYVGVGLNQGGDPTEQGPYALADDVVCPDLPFVQAEGVATGVHGLYTDYWKERDYNNYAEDVQAAFFYVHGFQDWNVKPDHILPWLDNLPDDTVAKAYLHQWYVEEDSGYKDGHVYPMREDWNLTMLRVMDHYLKGIDTGIEDEPAFHVQDSTGTWRTEEDWPPAHAQPYSLYPSDGGLTPDAEARGSGTVTSDGDPLTFRIKLDEDLHYAGMPVLKARLSTTDPYTGWVATLTMVDAAGETTWMNEGVLRAYLRNSMETPSLVVPGEMYDHVIDFYPQDDVFPAGSELVLSIDTDGARHTMNRPTPVTFGVDLSATELVLPRIDAANVTLEDPQPVLGDCFAC